MENLDVNMFGLADNLQEIRSRKAEVKSELDELTKKEQAAELQLFNAMKAQQVSSFYRGSQQFVSTRMLRPSPEAEWKQEVYKQLKANGFGDMVQETINAQTFGAFVRELIEFKSIKLDAEINNPDNFADLGEDAEYLDETTKEKLIIDSRLPKWLQGMLNLPVTKQVQIRKK